MSYKGYFFIKIGHIVACILISFCCLNAAEEIVHPSAVVASERVVKSTSIASLLAKMAGNFPAAMIGFAGIYHTLNLELRILMFMIDHKHLSLVALSIAVCLYLNDDPSFFYIFPKIFAKGYLTGLALLAIMVTSYPLVYGILTMSLVKNLWDTGVDGLFSCL